MVLFTEVALYQVNDYSNEEDSDDEHGERKTINPEYIYQDSCFNYHQILKKSAKKYIQNIRASDNTLRGTVS